MLTQPYAESTYALVRLLFHKKNIKLQGEWYLTATHGKTGAWELSQSLKYLLFQEPNIIQNHLPVTKIT